MEEKKMAHTLTKISRWYRGGVYFIRKDTGDWTTYLCSKCELVLRTSRSVLLFPAFFFGVGCSCSNINEDFNSEISVACNNTSI